MEVKRVKGPGEKILKGALKALDDKVGKVGWFEKARYPDGEQNPVASVAYIQEFGGLSSIEGKQVIIPPRPFMRPTIEEKKEDWKKITDHGAKKIMQGKSSIATVMDEVGQKAAGQIRKKISSIWSPPLSIMTIQRRLDRIKSKSGKRYAKKTLREKGSGNWFGGVGASIAKPLIDTNHMFSTLTSKVEKE